MSHPQKKILIIIVVLCVGLIAAYGLRIKPQTPLTIEQAKDYFTKIQDPLKSICTYFTSNPPAKTLYLRESDLENYPKDFQKSVKEFYQAVDGRETLIEYAPYEDAFGNVYGSIEFSLHTYAMGKDEEGARIDISQYFVYFSGPLPTAWTHDLYVAIKSDTRGTWQLSDHWLFASLRN